MDTLNMIQDWKESNFKKKYTTKGHGSKLPYTVYNNGVGILFCSCFVITIKEPLRKSSPFTINSDNLGWEWKEISEELKTEEAIKEAQNGHTMISLASAKVLNLDDEVTLTIEEVLGKWIERY